MHTKGHYGVTLLLGAGAIAILGLQPGVLATAIMAAVTPLPDIDQRITGIRHRGPTHSLVFVIAVAIVTANTVAYPVSVGQSTAMQWGLLSAPMFSPGRVWLLVGTATLAGLVGHLVADVLTEGGGYQVRLLWPVVSRSYAVGLFTADSTAANVALLATGSTATGVTIVLTLVHSGL